MLRRLHDASIGFADDRTRSGSSRRASRRRWSRVNDFAPYNLVLDGDRIIGVIDLDQASPGPRARDLAHLAYRLVPLTAAGEPGRARRPRPTSEAVGSGCSPTRTATSPPRPC